MPEFKSPFPDKESYVPILQFENSAQANNYAEVAASCFDMDACYPHSSYAISPLHFHTFCAVCGADPTDETVYNTFSYLWAVNLEKFASNATALVDGKRFREYVDDLYNLSDEKYGYNKTILMISKLLHLKDILKEFSYDKGLAYRYCSHFVSHWIRRCSFVLEHELVAGKDYYGFGSAIGMCRGLLVNIVYKKCDHLLPVKPSTAYGYAQKIDETIARVEETLKQFSSDNVSVRSLKSKSKKKIDFIVRDILKSLNTISKGKSKSNLNVQGLENAISDLKQLVYSSELYESFSRSEDKTDWPFIRARKSIDVLANHASRHQYSENNINLLQDHLLDVLSSLK